MKKLWKFLISIVLGVMTMSIGFSSWAHNVEAKADNIVQYSNVSGRIDNYLNSSSTPYASFTTLEDAVASANANATGSDKVNMYLVVGSAMETSNKTLTLNSGVNLYLPYSEKLTDVEDNNQISSLSNTLGDSNSTNVSNNRKNQLKLINTKITVSSGASIVVGGLTKTYGVCSSYAEITLDPNSNISVYGSLTVLGFIKKSNTVNGNTTTNADIIDNSYDSNRFVTMHSGSSLKTFLGIYDMSGGGTLNTLNSNKICPLNQFNFPCIQTYLAVNAGSKFTGVIHLDVAGNVVNTTACVISSSSSDKPLFTLSSGSVVFEYCAANALYSSTSNKTKIVISGQVSLGSLSFSVSGVSLTTSDRFLPLSSKLKIYIANGATFTIGYKVKLLCGSYLKIMKGGTINLSSSFIAYTVSATEDSLSGQSALGDATFINNGSLVLTSSGSIGALIQTESNDGTAIVDLSNTPSSKLSVSSNETTENVDITIITTGYFVDGTSTSLAQFQANSTATSNTTDPAGWIGEFNASYTLTVTVQNLYKYNLCGYRVYVADDASGSNSTELTSEEVNTTKSFSGISNKQYFKVDSATTAASTTFTTLPTGTSYTFNRSNWFLMTGDIGITIVPNEGVLIQISTQSVSGAGTTTYKIKNSSTNSELASFTANGEVIMAQGTSFKIEFTGGTNSSLNKVTYDTITKTSLTTNASTTVANFDSAFIADDSYKFYVTLKESGSCLTPDTRVLMANGQYRPVGSLDAGDEVLVFNHETGTVDVAPILFNERDPAVWHNVINLEFSNGETIKVVGEHGYFDKTTMKYEYINEDTFESYVGDYFYSLNGDVLLERAYITREYTDVCEPATRYHINFFTESMLSMPGGIEGLFNIFEYDQTLKYNEELKNRDIELYGLFTYADFADLVTEQLFNCYPTPYFKVAIGKGILTEERLMYYIERYGWYNS